MVYECSWMDFLQVPFRNATRIALGVGYGNRGGGNFTDSELFWTTSPGAYAILRDQASSLFCPVCCVGIYQSDHHLIEYYIQLHEKQEPINVGDHSLP